MFVQIPTKSTKQYNYYENQNQTIYLLKGKTQDGNAFIIDNSDKILSCEYDKLIWFHADGPSPHFIIRSNNPTKSDLDCLEKFIKENCPKKSNTSIPLHIAFLKNLEKTSTIGRVIITEHIDSIYDIMN